MSKPKHLRETLLEAARIYCERTGKSRATLSTMVRNDGKFFDNLESGRSCTIDTYEMLMAWFVENTPADTQQEA